MNKSTMVPALAVLAALALSACGKGDGGAPTASSSAATRTTTAQAPATASPAATPAPGAATPGPSTTAMGAGPAASSAGGKGQAVYAQTCVACHGAGVAGAPKLGDKADWGPRVAQGKDVLYTHALQGFTGKKGVMPPKGGNTSVPDADVKAAVDYMVAQVK